MLCVCACLQCTCSTLCRFHEQIHNSIRLSHHPTTHTAPHCNMLPYTATHCTATGARRHSPFFVMSTLFATHCTTLQRVAFPCNTLHRNRCTTAFTSRHIVNTSLVTTQNATAFIFRHSVNTLYHTLHHNTCTTAFILRHGVNILYHTLHCNGCTTAFICRHIVNTLYHTLHHNRCTTASTCRRIFRA